MENNFFELTQTNQALSALSADIASLATSIKAKKELLKKQYQNCESALLAKEQSLEELQLASAEVLADLDGVISQLEKVLEDNGSGNNNN